MESDRQTVNQAIAECWQCGEAAKLLSRPGYLMGYDTRKETSTSKKSKDTMAKGRKNLIKQLRSKDELIAQFKTKLSDNDDND